jgi:hypothetical protein
VAPNPNPSQLNGSAAHRRFEPFQRVGCSTNGGLWPRAAIKAFARQRFKGFTRIFCRFFERAIAIQVLAFQFNMIS